MYICPICKGYSSRCIAGIIIEKSQSITWKGFNNDTRISGGLAGVVVDSIRKESAVLN